MSITIERHSYNDCDKTTVFVEGEWILMDNLTATLCNKEVLCEENKAKRNYRV